MAVVCIFLATPNIPFLLRPEENLNDRHGLAGAAGPTMSALAGRIAELRAHVDCGNAPTTALRTEHELVPVRVVAGGNDNLHLHWVDTPRRHGVHSGAGLGGPARGRRDIEAISTIWLMLLCSGT